MIQHVALETRPDDIDACLHFWWLLGFERVAAPPALAERSVWVQAGATQVHLLLADEPVVAPDSHVAVVVADFDATFANLARAGYEPEQRTQHWGSPRAFVRSPGGQRVEFMAFSPQS
jgi:catechol 2,3-dioxygenase-like lactoylglutathione lyase family enzyme